MKLIKKFIYAYLKCLKRIPSNPKGKRYIIIGVVLAVSIIALSTTWQDRCFSGSKSGFYTLDGDKIPSIESIVGNRNFELIYKDKKEFSCSYYNVKNPVQDIKQYIGYLSNESGYMVSPPSQSDFRLTNDTKTLVMDITFDGSGYVLHIWKGHNGL